MSKLDILKKTKEALDALVLEKQEVESDNADETEAVKLALLLESNESIREAIEKSALSKEDLANAVSEAILKLKIDVPKIDAPQVTVHVPEIVMPAFPAFPAYPEFQKIELPEIKIPEAKVTVTIPEIKLPTINVPETVINFPDKMDARLEYTHKNPLPVMQVDPAGNFIAPSIGGGGGGKTDFLTIKGFSQSAYSAISNPDGRIRVSMESGGGSLTDTELRAAHIDVQQVSGAIDSVSVVSTVGLTDTQLRAGTLDVRQVSGASWSTTSIPVGNSFVNVSNATSSTVIKTGSGVIHTLTINTRGTGSVATIYDDTYGQSGNTIASIDTTLSTTGFLYDITFTNGLTLVTSGASGANLTISYT